MGLPCSMYKGLLSAKQPHCPLGAGAWVLVRCLKIVRCRLLETEEKLERKPSVNKSTDAGCSNLVGKRWAWREPESVTGSQRREESRFLDKLAWPQSSQGGLCSVNDPRHCLVLLSPSPSVSHLRLSVCLLKRETVVSHNWFIFNPQPSLSVSN